ncbi:MAG: hypothetical protein JSR58_06650 [Verrucomicrobia bacterium]|nr:hypothetical protein [Verrucomicrobiota bacterium]
MIKKCVLICGISCAFLLADNQTATVSPVLPSNLPFRIKIEIADFSLPIGVQTYASGISNDKYVIIAGRLAGSHTFNLPFPPDGQNPFVFVIDPEKKSVSYRSLADPSSGLSQTQIDALSTVAPQYYQSGQTLYVCGGYGIDTASGQFNTKSSIASIDMEGLIHWVTHPSKKGKASKHIRFTSDPLLQIAGGYLTQTNPHLPTMLIFGINYTGTDFANVNGVYSMQIRRFNVVDNGHNFYVRPDVATSMQPFFRRRDLNIMPVMKKTKTTYEPALVALSGVFTTSPIEPNIWTVPIEISQTGDMFMPDPNAPSTFKQAMNNYECANVGLYSKKHNNMYLVLLGGLSYGFFDNTGTFQLDNFIGYINQVTTIQIDKHNNYQQFIMPDQYPFIASSVPGDFYRFGAGAKFFPAKNAPLFANKVVQLDELSRSKPTLIGYIIGGIQSPEQNLLMGTIASTYIFRVIYQPL